MSVSTASGVSATHVDPNIFRGDVAPTGAVEGTLWIDTSTNPNTLNVADSSGTFSPISGGGGGSSTPLKPWDFWKDSRFTITSTPQEVFLGAAISGGGTANGGSLIARQDGYWLNGVLLHKGTTANGGYRWTGSVHGAIRFGTMPLEFWAAWRPVSFTSTTVRLGLHDSISLTAPLDGPYFDIINDVVTGKCATNSVTVNTNTTFSLTVNTVYLFRIQVNTDASLTTFTILDGLSEAVLWQDTVSGGLSSLTTRSGGAGIVATQGLTTAGDIGILYWMGYGTPDGFTKARG